MKKLLKVSLISLSILLGLVLVLAAILTPVDETPYARTDAYARTQAALSRLPATGGVSEAAPGPEWLVGWARVNITPPQPGPMAGYGVRYGKPFDHVRDSVYFRAMVFDNGLQKAAILAADLLIMPPTVVAALQQRLPALGWRPEQLYFGAIHSHNSIGGWGIGLGGEQFAGKFDSSVVAHLADAAALALQRADAARRPARLRYGQVRADSLVANRLADKEGTTDPMARFLQIQQVQGPSALLLTFAAHATILDGSNMSLSRDYPGVVVDALESGGVSFAMFMAGAVGSMKPLERGPDDEAELRTEGDSLSHLVARALPTARPSASRQLALLTVPLHLRPPQFQVIKGWKLRPWAWNLLFGEATADVKALRLGDVVLLGMPADFSGELVAPIEAAARQKGLHLLITSFNGNYIGYITPDHYWLRDTYESTTMNWFGPQTGSYVVGVARQLLEKL